MGFFKRALKAGATGGLSEVANGGMLGLTDKLGLTDSGAGDRAIYEQAKAMREANELMKKNYGEAKERYSPYSKEGLNAFQQMIALANGQKDFSEADGYFKGHSGVFSMDDFEADPGYQFRMDEAMKALNRRAAAQGMTNSGSTLKELARFGQNLASQEYGNAYNRFNNDYQNARNRYNDNFQRKYNSFNNIANFGRDANAAITNAGNNYSTRVSSNVMGLGNSKASNEINRGNAMKDLWKMGFQAGGAAMGARG